MPEKYKVELFDFKGKDFAELARLTHEYFTELQRYDASIVFAEGWEPHYRQTMEAAMVSPRFFTRGVRVKGQTAGFIMFGFRDEPMWQMRNRGYLSNIYVIPALRRNGLGRLMVQDALKTLRRMDVKVMELDVYCANDTGRLFWQSLGFRNVKERLRLDLA
jgi:ribosomal protein S18 acetylase RimI-like enzyme